MRKSWLTGSCIIVLLTSIQASAQSAPTAVDVANWFSVAVDLFGPTSTGGDWNIRKAVFDAIDDAVDVPADPTLHPFANPITAEFIASLHEIRLNVVIQKLQTDPPPPVGSIRLYKTYSSGWIIVTHTTKLAIDFSVGFFFVTGNNGFTNAQMTALANLIDGYIITHKHLDHYAGDLADAMLMMGKPVFVTHEMQTSALLAGTPNAASLIAPAEGMTYSVGDISFTPHEGHQFSGLMGSGPTATVDWTAPWVQNNGFLIDAGGVGILHLGDDNDPTVFSWLSQMVSQGWNPEIFLNLGVSGTAANVLQTFSPNLRFHTHDLEFAHPYGVFLPLDQTPWAIDPARVVLFWGESFDYTP
ncbi:MAG TPA: MBL fold metallo-hydrolase [Planctomycetes bacterium]|nr:MBL fold metallo-hydrolase [Planctomycetota bacterium]